MLSTQLLWSVGDTSRLEFHGSVGWKERENSGWPSDRPALGRFKEGRLFRDEKELLLVQKILRPGFDLVAHTGGGRLITLQLRYKGQGCRFVRHLC